MFKFEGLKDNPRAQVRIAGLKVNGKAIPTIVGYLKQETSIGGTNTYNNPFESAAVDGLANITGKVIAGANAVKGMFDPGKGEGIPPIQLKNMNQTAISWTGSSKPTFQIDLVFPAFRETDDCTIFPRQLYAAVYPTKESFMTIKAPMGYTMNRDKDSQLVPDPAILISIGRWLTMPNMVITSVNFTYSIACLESGKPLYSTGQVSVEPFRMITYDELLKWFV